MRSLKESMQMKDKKGPGAESSGTATFTTRKERRSKSRNGAEMAVTIGAHQGRVSPKPNG